MMTISGDYLARVMNSVGEDFGRSGHKAGSETFLPEWPKDFGTFVPAKAVSDPTL
jgi:hypothetical protein